jgi:hypothetical protein
MGFSNERWTKALLETARPEREATPQEESTK